MARRREDPVVIAIEVALAPGSFIEWRECSAFVDSLDEVKERLQALVDGGSAAKGVELYELFIAACYEKVEEVDDSDGEFGTFAESLFTSWIRARQAAGADPDETAATLLAWMEDDDYGFCYELEGSAVVAFDRKGLSAYERAVRREWLEREAGGNREAAERRHRAFAALRSIHLKRGNAASYERVCEESGEFEPADCLTLAKICLRRSRPEDALAWVERGLAREEAAARPWPSALGLAEQRRKILRKLGRGEEALSSAWEGYRRRPSTSAYDQLMGFVPEADRDEWRRKALEAAEGAAISATIPLFVKLRERDRLSDLVRATSREDLMSLSHYTTEPAAQQLERKHPLSAAKLQVAMGLRILVAKKSKYYGASLGHLEKARDLLLKSSRAEEWQDLVAAIRSEHSRKYSFMPGFERVVSGRREPTWIDRVRKRRDRGPGRRTS